MRPVVLTVAGSDSGGGAGIQMDLEAITVLGGHGVSVITALTAQNTQGVKAVEPIGADFVAAQLDAILEDFEPLGTKTGMLWSREVILTVAKRFKAVGIKNLVVDPVLFAKGGERLLKKDAIRALQEELFPLARVLTPNIPEAEALTGLPIRDREEMLRAARKLLEFGPEAIFLKGGHLEGDPWDLLLWSGGYRWFPGERFPREAHGTGCALSAALATFLAFGHKLQEACARAKAFLSEGIALAKVPGKGREVFDPLVQIEREASRWEVVEDLRRAYLLLERGKIGMLIPEVGSNLVYALRGARDPSEVAGIEGRIVRVGDGIAKVGDITFGASRHMASVVLEVMKFDPSIRAAMNIRYGEDVLGASRKLSLKMASFSRRDEPQEIREREGASLPWGVKNALESSGTVPDLICDEGGWGKEAMVRVLGRDPQEVVQKVLALSKEI